MNEGRSIQRLAPIKEGCKVETFRRARSDRAAPSFSLLAFPPSQKNMRLTLVVNELISLISSTEKSSREKEEQRQTKTRWGGRETVSFELELELSAHHPSFGSLNFGISTSDSYLLPSIFASPAQQRSSQLVRMRREGKKEQEGRNGLSSQAKDPVVVLFFPWCFPWEAALAASMRFSGMMWRERGMAG